MSTCRALLISTSLSYDSDACPFSSLELVDTARPVSALTSLIVISSCLRRLRMAAPGAVAAVASRSGPFMPRNIATCLLATHPCFPVFPLGRKIFQIGKHFAPSRHDDDMEML